MAGRHHFSDARCNVAQVLLTMKSVNMKPSEEQANIPEELENPQPYNAYPSVIANPNPTLTPNPQPPTSCVSNHTPNHTHNHTPNHTHNHAPNHTPNHTFKHTPNHAPTLAARRCLRIAA